MTRERRNNGKNVYAYRSVRAHDGRVVKKYLGRYDSPAVQVILQQEELNRAEQKLANDRDKAMADEYRRFTVDLFEAHHWVDTIVDAWRLVHDSVHDEEGEFGMDTVRFEQPCDVTFDLEKFEQIVREANGGSDAALAELRDVLDNQPAVWRTVGDLGAHVRRQLLHTLAGDDALMLDSIDRNLGNLADYLARETNGKIPPMMQRMLIDRALVCWLDIHHVQAQFSQKRNSRMVQRFWGQQLDRAQRRYFQAIDALKS